MRAGFNKWWLLPFGVLLASALVASSILVFEPFFTSSSSAEAAQQASSEPDQTSKAETVASEPVETSGPDEASEAEGTTSEPAATSEVATADCSGAKASDYICYQKRYRDLVLNYGVEAAFAGLRDDLTKDGFVRSNCHQMTHVIGRTAAEVYGDLPSTYSHGDSFCGSGYYHGAMETIVAKIGPVKILDKANTLCSDLGGHQRYSVYHYNCAHGLGHGFMGIQENELFKALQTCDALTDEWERNRCYGGVFMENVIDRNNPSHPSKYLKADSPLYPCDIVGTRYKNECYQRQTSYALERQGNDFARVFDLCAKVEGDFRPSCYQGLGWDASVQSLDRGGSGAAINESTNQLCMPGKDYEARFNCVVGASEYFVRHYYSDTQAKTFCGSLSMDLRADCLQEVEEYYKSLRPPSER